MDKPTDAEEAYFLEREREQREAMRKQMAADAVALEKDQEIQAASGVSDELATRLRKLGFTGDTVHVLDLFPMVVVAWADGRIQPAERSTILHMVESKGIKQGEPAFQFVECLLEQKPDANFQEQAIKALREMLSEKREGPEKLVELMHEVADRAGGLFGLGGGVNRAERKAVESVVQTFGSAAQGEFKKLFG